MLACWELDPAARPTFTEIRVKLDEIFGKIARQILFYTKVCIVIFLLSTSQIVEQKASYLMIGNCNRQAEYSDAECLCQEIAADKKHHCSSTTEDKNGSR